MFRLAKWAALSLDHVCASQVDCTHLQVKPFEATQITVGHEISVVDAALEHLKPQLTEPVEDSSHANLKMLLKSSL